jgi:hypothetical protein
MEQKCMTAQGYSHAKYEDILLKKPAIFIDWYERILLPLIRVHYIMSEQRNAGKLLIFCTTLDFIAKVRNALKSEFPHKKIAWYTGEDERDVLDINDIIISTPKGCGTGTDIKNLRCVINTVSYQAITTAFQMPGRLRKIDGVELHYVDTVNLFVGAQVRHWQERSGVFKQISTEYKEYRIP